jgi:DNA (cytosine-5)-methyltransferase 1
MAEFVLDLYAGAGGWSEGAAMVGLPGVGVELAADPCLTAARAGHLRIRADVAAYPTAPFVGRVTGLTGSPPCQPWSTAGKRLGEEDRPRVHALVDAYAVHDPDAERAWSWTAWADPDSHHAAQPVRWVRDLRPRFVCLEQVPGVLGLWRHVARVLRPWGYSTWCGILNSADFGVPQTRRRAILIARLDGPAVPPEPTHAKDPVDGLFGTLLPWVSMAQALGWGRPAVVRSSFGGPTGLRSGTHEFAADDRPSHTVTGKTRSWQVDERPARTVCGSRAPRWAYGDGASSYATGWTLQSRRDGPGWIEGHGNRDDRAVDEPAPTVTGEAGRWALRNNTSANGCERDLDEPAGTLFFGERLNDVAWVLRSAHHAKTNDRTRTRTGGEPAHTVAFGNSAMEWVPVDDDTDQPVKITIVEAAVLQSFPPDYPWAGNKTSQFLQVGNAVPPLLAARVLDAARGGGSWEP